MPRAQDKYREEELSAVQNPVLMFAATSAVKDNLWPSFTSFRQLNTLISLRKCKKQI